jgi:hypothetical protein
VTPTVARRRLGREVLAVDRVHRREVGEVAEVDRGLDDVGVVEPDRAEQPADVVEHGAGLGLDATRHRAVAARDVTNLAGEEDEPVGLDDLRERVRTGLEVGSGRDGLRHGGLLGGFEGDQRSRASEPAVGRIDGTRRPPGEVVAGRHARREDRAGFRVEALAPAAQQ